MAKKLPYIPDKNLYAAVMGACSWIREKGYFNKATEYYARRYGVDVEDVQRLVRIAQSNGQKQAAKRKSRVYKYYVVIYIQDYYLAGDGGSYASWGWTKEDCRKHTRIGVRKAISEKNVIKQFDCGLSYADSIDYPHNEDVVLKTFEFDSKVEADNYANSLKWEDIKGYVAEHCNFGDMD